MYGTWMSICVVHKKQSKLLNFSNLECLESNTFAEGYYKWLHYVTNSLDTYFHVCVYTI